MYVIEAEKKWVSFDHVLKRIFLNVVIISIRMSLKLFPAGSVNK